MDRLADFLSIKQVDLGFVIKNYQDADYISFLMQSREGRRLLKTVLDGDVIGEIFWQESSRTLHSFASAANRLGADVVMERGVRRRVKKNGKIITRYELIFSSEMKDAWLEDEIKAWASYYDLLILRTPDDILIEELRSNLRYFGYTVPLVSGGDGTREHPSQTFIDGYALLKGLNFNVVKDWRKLSECSIAFINDNKNARVVKSLAWFLAKLFKMNLIFISPEGLEPSAEFLAELKKDCPDARITVSNDLLPADAYYVIRNQSEYGSKKECFSVTRQVADKFGVKVVMHPFPRSKYGNELPIWLPSDPRTHAVSLDMDSRAFYFYQMAIGKPIRMALLKYFLNPDLDLKKLREEKLVRELRSQCICCNRIEYEELGWTENPPACGRIQTLPHIFCPNCQPKKTVA